MYEYKFIEVALNIGLKVKVDDTFGECKNIIQKEVKMDGIKASYYFSR